MKYCVNIVSQDTQPENTMPPSPNSDGEIKISSHMQTEFNRMKTIFP